MAKCELIRYNMGGLGAKPPRSWTFFVNFGEIAFVKLNILTIFSLAAGYRPPPKNKRGDPFVFFRTRRISGGGGL